MTCCHDASGEGDHDVSGGHAVSKLRASGDSEVSAERRWLCGGEPSQSSEVLETSPSHCNDAGEDDFGRRVSAWSVLGP